MGQKVNPVGFRLGIIRTWDSRWFAKKDYANLLLSDFKIRELIRKDYSAAGIAKVVIERPAKKVNIDIHAARPGMLIGKGGTDLEKLRNKVSKIAGAEVAINIVNVRKPELDAYLIAEGIAFQIEKRVSYRRAMKRAMQAAMKLGAGGIRCNVSGRLGGAEIARTEWYREGRVPLHTLRSDVDFSVGVAKTTYGTCGVKVWVYHGDSEVGDFVPRDKKG
ncbi:MAG: 30S ribosomal protein S3 [Holosporales bacterium]|jgi:small subunit ribosomal protein S3|nr:30S ribosomal protein S3 [Holosporales bacterium]